MTWPLFNCAAASPTLQPLPIDIVSVQSQVIYGYVGNKVAVSILESFGLAVAAAPMTMFSNTPHNPTIHGKVLPSKWFNGYLLDLSAHDALRQTRTNLPGYLGNLAQAEVLARWVSNPHDERPSLQVIGVHDHGGYVNPGMIVVYRRHLLPLTHDLTPNGFELERLTGQPTSDIERVITAARTLLTRRTQWVAVTSAALTGHLPDWASVFEAAAQACNQVVIALKPTRRTCCAELLLPPMGRTSCPG